MNVGDQVHSKGIVRYAEDHDLRGVKVLLRIDVNVALTKTGDVDSEDNWRIQAAYRTINFLTQQGAQVIVISHLGRDKDQSLKPVFEVMSQSIQLGFLPSYDGELLTHTIEHMQHGSVMMLENLRQHDGETENDSSFLMPVITLCDLYVNDAFSVSHREHASVHDITKHLPSYFGLQFVDEVTHLEEVRKGNKKTTLILGGAKFGTKLTLLERMLPDLEYVLMGGALANVFLKARGFEVGKSFVDDVDISSMLSNEKIILPIDCIDQEGDILPIDSVGEHDMILDIGPDTEALFEQIIAHAECVVWNGPMGKYEEGYISGSLAVAESMSHSSAYSVTGGGDTASVIVAADKVDAFSFISTGGGAMLDFLIEGTLPGISAIV